MSNIERRIARLESLAKVMNEAEDFSEKEKVFTYLCKSCNLTDVSFRGKTATCKFDMSTFYRRIQKRVRVKYWSALKSMFGKDCRIICNMETQEWTIKVGDESEPLTRNIVPQAGDSISLIRDNRRVILSCIGYALERIIDRMNESVDRKSKWRFNESSGQPSVTMLVDGKTNKPFPVEGKLYITPRSEDDKYVKSFDHEMYNKFKDAKFKSIVLSNPKLNSFDGDICKFLAGDGNGRVIIVDKWLDFNSLINIIVNGAELKKNRANYKNVTTVDHTKSWLTESEDDDDVIRKVDNKWKILKKNRKDYWDADYDTKADAEAALRAYLANKHECKRQTSPIVVEGFLSDVGRDLLRNVQSFLIKVFGHTLYFDHYTDKAVDLLYRGDEVAELYYNDKDEEIVIMPSDTDITPVSFYDTSEAEIKDYLSDLILGDLNPEFA